MEYKSRHVKVQTDSKNVIVGDRSVLLCHKQSTKEIERMLASINIVWIAKIYINLVLTDVEKAQKQSSLYAPLLNSIPGQREVFN